MKMLLAGSAIAFASTFSMSAQAADSAACQASWAKMDGKTLGYVLAADAKDHMDMLTKAGRKTAAADRISDKEYMDACIADVFMAGKK